jgi:hypothetical protein
MGSIPSDSHFFIFTAALDMRVGMDRLAAIVADSGKQIINGGYYWGDGYEVSFLFQVYLQRSCLLNRESSH